MPDNNSPQTTAGSNSRQGDNQSSSRRAWYLVIIMLLALTILVIFVLIWPLDSTCQEPPASNEQAVAATVNANANAAAPGNANATENANTKTGAGGGTPPISTPSASTPTPQQTPPSPAVRQPRTANDPCLQFRTTILDRRKDFLALLISAFGAWVGAGAAYFFGRENLHAATDSLLRMQQQTSGGDRLRATQLSQIPPIPLSWLAQKTDTLGKAYDWLKEDTKRWFIPVVDEAGALIFVLKGEALYHYYIDAVEGTASPPLSPPMHFRDIPLSQVIEDINTNDRYSLYRKVYVTVSMNMSVETANELMDRQGIFLAIIVDEHHKPTHYITTTEVRKLLLG